MTSREVKIFYRGSIHPSKWLEIKKILIKDCPETVTALYYSRPDKGNDLLSVNEVPEFYTIEGREIIGAEELPHVFIERIKRGDWWVKLEEGYKYIPVYQYCPNKWIFIAYVDIPSDYEYISALYYSQPDENDLLSVSDQPSFYHLDNNNVLGSESVSRLFLSRISKAGWWGDYNPPNVNQGSLAAIIPALLSF